MNLPEGQAPADSMDFSRAHITTELFPVDGDVGILEAVAVRAFGDSADADISQWFSFPQMVRDIGEGHGACVVAKDENGGTLGWSYAGQESPINGPEGAEKWVIVAEVVDPERAQQGIGSKLLNAIQEQATNSGANKLFAYTTDSEENAGVVEFYEKNGFQIAGRIQDYQYGKGNSAIWLMKWLRDPDTAA